MLSGFLCGLTRLYALGSSSHRIRCRANPRCSASFISRSRPRRRRTSRRRSGESASSLAHRNCSSSAHSLSALLRRLRHLLRGLISEDASPPSMPSDSFLTPPVYPDFGHHATPECQVPRARGGSAHRRFCVHIHPCAPTTPRDHATGPCAPPYDLSAASTRSRFVGTPRASAPPPGTETLGPGLVGQVHPARDEASRWVGRTRTDGKRWSDRDRCPTIE